MTGGHGVSLKPCFEVNYAFRKRKGVIEDLERCAQLEKYSTIMSWLEGREYTGDHYKKLRILQPTDSSLSMSF